MNKQLIAHLCLEFCIGYWMIIKSIDLSVSQYVAPLFLYCIVLIPKFGLLLKQQYTFSYKLMILITMMFHSLSLGCLTLFKTVQISYIQIIILAQYVYSYRLSAGNEMIVILVFMMVPLAFYQESFRDALQILMFSVLAFVLRIFLGEEQIEEDHQEQKIALQELQSSRTPRYSKPEGIKTKEKIKQQILKQWYFKIQSSTWLTVEDYVILNENLELAFPSDFKLQSLAELNESKLTEEILLKKFLNICPQTISKSLIRVLMNMNTDRSSQIRQKNTQDIRTLLRQLSECPNAKSGFYVLNDLNSRSFKVHDKRLNLIVISDEDNIYENYYVIMFETLQESINDKKSDKQSLIFLSMKSKVEEEQSNSKLLHNIFQSVSHEFGTYLNCINTIAIEALSDAFVNEEQKKNYFKPISINARLLEFILKNIRDYNQIISGGFLLRAQECNIKILIQEIIDLVFIQATQRDIKIINNCQDDLIFFNDADRFQQVLYQIISNSVRFTHAGSIEIHIISKSNPLTIEVKDTGIGMSMEEQSKLSDLLSDPKKLLKVSKNSVGCGMGLSISSILVMKMNNDQAGISFRSEYGKGTSFKFSIQNQNTLYINSVHTLTETQFKVIKASSYYILDVLSESSDDAELHEDQSMVVENFKRKIYTELCNQGNQQVGSKFLNFTTLPAELNMDIDQEIDLNKIEQTNINIQQISPKFKQKLQQSNYHGTCCNKALIVDDEYFNVQSMRMILSKFRIKSDMAFDGQQALDKVIERLHNPCQLCGSCGYVLFFLDINMPIMDGFETVQELKKLMQDGSIPKGLCIANSGFCDFDTIDKAIKCGMDNFFTKPIRVSDLDKYISDKFPGLSR